MDNLLGREKLSDVLYITISITYLLNYEVTKINTVIENGKDKNIIREDNVTVYRQEDRYNIAS